MALLDKNYKGLLSTDVVNADTQPEDWSPVIHHVVPAGRAPFAAIMNAIGGRPTKSRRFHWPEQMHPEQRAAVTGTFTDAALSSAYTSGGVVDTVLYFKMSEEDASQFVANQQALAINGTTDVYRGTSVKQVVRAGANSYVAAALFEADTGNALASTGRLLISGNAQGEGGDLPNSIGREPQYFDGLTQIHAMSTNISGTKLAEEERLSPSFLQRMRMDAALRLLVEQEKALMFGEKATKTINGKEFRYMEGLIPGIRDNSGNIFDYKNDSDADINGKTFLQGGSTWLSKKFEEIFRKTETGRKTSFIGSEALLSVELLIETLGWRMLEARQNEFGISIRTLVTVFGEVDLVLDPLFTTDPLLRKAMLAVELPLLEKRTLRPTIFLPDINADLAHAGPDRIREGWRGEWGLQVDNYEVHGFFKNLGTTNVN